MKIAQFRLKQYGSEVARVVGPINTAVAEINRYAEIYSQDGPVEIERHINGRWRPETKSKVLNIWLLRQRSRGVESPLPGGG